MREDERGEPAGLRENAGKGPGRPRGNGSASGAASRPADLVIESTISPFHCLYGDALEFHKQCCLAEARSEADTSRLARAALLLYLQAAEALVHQAAVELGRPELAVWVADPKHPLSLLDTWRLLPALIAESPRGPYDPESPPWPQFAELLSLRDSWLYPGIASKRRAYYFQAAPASGDFEPIDPHQIPPGLESAIPADRLAFPLTGLPRDPYALRRKHIDAARTILDEAIAALDRRLGGALTRDRRHRNEPVRVISQP